MDVEAVGFDPRIPADVLPVEVVDGIRKGAAEGKRGRFNLVQLIEKMVLELLLVDAVRT